jgi:hypothetical protein
VTHGLCARRDVIRGEDREEFERHRRGMLEDVTPAGVMEEARDRRIASLTWRLIRAERMQGLVLDTLFDEYCDGMENADEWAGAEFEKEALARDRRMGKALANDFACTKVLERVLAYEQQIKGSLYKAMPELQKLRKARRADGATSQNKANPQEDGPSVQNKANRRPMRTQPPHRLKPQSRRCKQSQSAGWRLPGRRAPAKTAGDFHAGVGSGPRTQYHGPL